MRLHSLSFTAFGPFAGTEVIDFDDLSDAGLFLLHGPTGAGKTTILDAVSFALFAKVPGARATGDSLRSDFADRAVATEVRLEVSIGEQRFRIVRRPRQVRPKTRGTGLREHPPTATVEELVAGAWVARASRPSEADPYLTERLHMGADQFHQLVMLPQGEFARFLRATADKRREVLEELFGTHRFAEVERWLKQQADTARAELRDADERIRRELVRAIAVADLDAEAFADDRPLAEATGWLADLSRRAAERAAVTRQAALDAEPVSQLALAALTDATTIAERQRRHAEATAAHAALAGELDAQATRRSRHDAAVQAAPVLPLAVLADRAAADLRRADRAAAAARRELATIDPDSSDTSRDELEARRADILAELSRVDDCGHDEIALDERSRQVEVLDGQIAELETGLERDAEERTAFPGERRRLTRLVRSAGKDADRLADLQRQAELLDERLAAAHERDRLEPMVEQQTARVADCKQVELDRREGWLDLRQVQLHHRAALLAADLTDGDPCPVCGSDEHPAPAVAAGPLVTDDEVDAAETNADLAVQATRDAAEVLARLERELATSAASAAGLATADIAEQQADLAVALAEARAAVQRRDDVQGELNALEARSAEIDEQRAEAEPLLLQAHQARAALAAELTEARTRVTTARAGHPSLAERRTVLDRERRALTDLIAALDVLSTSTDASTNATSAAEDEAVVRGFADLDAARAAALPEPELTELAAAIATHDRAVAETAADLARPELTAAAALAPVDLAPLREANDEAQRARDVAAIAADAADKARCKLDALEGEIVAAISARAPQIEQHETLRRLADLANGDDRQVEQRMRLSTYVLSARLEQVAAAASVRLSRMSGGQFTIVHTDDPIDGRHKGGLGLRVVDAWTGTERETSTLSGGQTFFTSLALALGVADVVGAETGGTRIDTLFIDEGFGSLDDDTLEQVMDVLDGLRAGGRTIGVVSHVADLRTRLTSQLEVVKSATGSHLRTRHAASSGVDGLNSTEPSTSTSDAA